MQNNRAFPQTCLKYIINILEIFIPSHHIESTMNILELYLLEFNNMNA